MCYCRSSVALLCAYLALAFFIYFPSRFHTHSSQKLSVRPYESANRLHTIRFACLQKSGFARQPKFGKTGCAQSNPYHERFSLGGKHSRFSCAFLEFAPLCPPPVHGGKERRDSHSQGLTGAELCEQGQHDNNADNGQQRP